MPQKQVGKLAWTSPAERGNWNERPKHILLRYFWAGFQKYSDCPNSGMGSNDYGGEEERRGTIGYLHCDVRTWTMGVHIYGTVILRNTGKQQLQEAMYCTYNATLRGVRVTTVVEEKQYVLHILSVSL